MLEIGDVVVKRLNALREFSALQMVDKLRHLELILLGGGICLQDPVDQKPIDLVPSKNLSDVLVGDEPELRVLREFVLYHIQTHMMFRKLSIQFLEQGSELFNQYFFEIHKAREALQKLEGVHVIPLSVEEANHIPVLLMVVYDIRYHLVELLESHIP